MPTVTVNGANGQVFPIQYASTDAYSAALGLANAINAEVVNPGVSTQVLTSAGTVTAPAAGKYGQLVLTNSGPAFQVSEGNDQIFVVNGTTPVTITGSNASGGNAANNNVSVLAGSGGLTFYAGQTAAGVNASGVVVIAGDGGNILGTATGTGGSAFFQSGSGNDTIQAVAGTNTVVAGLGLNTIGLGNANDVVYTTGVDVINGDITPGGGGSATISAVGNGSDFIQAFSSSIFFVSGSTAASTLVGGTGSDTVFAGAAGGQFYAGTGGNSSLVGGSGTVTLVGGGNGDQLFSIYSPGATPSAAGSAYLVAGGANETISGALDSRGIQAFAGNNLVSGTTTVTANTVIFGGSGSDTIYAGSGNATLNSGGGSADVFGFRNGLTGGNDTINGFNSSDLLRLSGYTSPAGSSATAAGVSVAGVSGVTVAGGNTQITLSDNTKITITGYTSLSNSNFG